ncbi:MAG: copper amine oxidase N-terminal domain-containing protein [Clostridia bacterium]|nr:copper amine oxidase N-terminal domain-containing protein [Clostridia bacterium]
MKKRLQGFIAGVLIGVTLTSGTVFAKQIKETAVIFYNNIKISLNGQEIRPKDANGNYVEPFIIDGTTYLPVRAVANALDINVKWDNKTNTVLLSNQKSENVATGFDSTSTANEISVVNEYYWETDYGNYIAIIIKNNSAYTFSPRIQISFKDNSGKIVGAKNQSENAFGPGSEIAFVFNNDEPFEKYEYTITANEEKYYEDCVSKLEFTHSITNEKVILQVKNNGKKPAKFVKYTILFKYRGKVVDYDWGYCTDDDYEIKAGMMEINEVSAVYKEKFDSVEIYLTGRSNR